MNLSKPQILKGFLLKIINNGVIIILSLFILRGLINYVKEEGVLFWLAITGLFIIQAIAIFDIALMMFDIKDGNIKCIEGFLKKIHLFFIIFGMYSYNYSIKDEYNRKTRLCFMPIYLNKYKNKKIKVYYGELSRTVVMIELIQ